ncbi:unnamed protein product [Phyllotreta striolata]|uniref:Protein sleepless n=1 Tax=Phyllotreta striolata TaxID=444603 RepID=A0A9N9TSD8_PHYSR|nr:unnamed protein product [Phyllotreta striolata]
MGHYAKILFCTILLYSYAASKVSKCYYCLLSDKCNDPFNSTFATVLNCSNPSTYKTLSMDNNNGFNGNRQLLQRLDQNDDYVCVKYVIKNSAQVADGVVTDRRCMQRYSSSNVAACDQVKQAMGTSSTLMSCSTCDNDLCNSAIRWNSLSSLTAAVAAVFVFIGLIW